MVEEDCESLQSDAEADESSTDPPKMNETSRPASASDPPAAPTAEAGQEDVEDRTEDRNFLAMLQLAPRSSIESSPTAESKSAHRVRPVRSGRSSRVPSEELADSSQRNGKNSDTPNNNEGPKPKRIYLATVHLSCSRRVY